MLAKTQAPINQQGLTMHTARTAATLQTEQFDDMTWAMSVLAGTEDGGTDHAEWMLTSLAAKGCTVAIRQAATSALLGGVLATA